MKLITAYYYVNMRIINDGTAGDVLRIDITYPKLREYTKLKVLAVDLKTLLWQFKLHIKNKVQGTTATILKVDVKKFDDCYLYDGIAPYGKLSKYKKIIGTTLLNQISHSLVSTPEEVA